MSFTLSIPQILILTGVILLLLAAVVVLIILLARLGSSYKSQAAELSRLNNALVNNLSGNFKRLEDKLVLVDESIKSSLKDSLANFNKTSNNVVTKLEEAGFKKRE